jgi:hypothetical protein
MPPTQVFCQLIDSQTIAARVTDEDLSLLLPAALCRGNRAIGETC